MSLPPVSSILPPPAVPPSGASRSPAFRGAAALLLAALVLSACAQGEAQEPGGLPPDSLALDDGGQTGSETSIACTPLEPVQVTLGESTSLGLSALDAVALLGTPASGRWLWSDGSESGATLDAELAADVAFVRRYEAPSPAAGGPDIAADCPDSLVVSVDLSASTDDGRLDETWRLDLVASSADRLSASTPVDPLAFGGSYDASSIALADGETLAIFVALAVDEGTLQLALEAQIEGLPVGDGEDAIVSVRIEDVGHFVP